MVLSLAPLLKEREIQNRKNFSIVSVTFKVFEESDDILPVGSIYGQKLGALASHSECPNVMKLK